MQASSHVARLGLLLLSALIASPSHAQTTSPPPGNLAAPVPHHGSATTETKPTAAPREPVHKVAPVIAPHGQTHAIKPRTAEKPAPAPVVPAPAPTPQAAAPPPPEEPTKGQVTGLPLPRFASLRTDEVNLRRGPGTRYPIDWVYKRRDLPVEIEREFEVWRLVADPDGIKGWVHQATLTGRRSFIVTGQERVLRREASDTSAPVARLMPGVIGHIRSCEAGSDWCQMQVGEYRGFLKRDAFWGALPNEAIND
jgi:SH3-like domain-containing protein